MAISVELPRKAHQCPACHQWTTKVHDYRIHKIKHLKWFERMTVIFYKRRRYACGCGKRFAEKVSFIERYQRFTKEANQALSIRTIKTKTFIEAAEVTGTPSKTVIRRFQKIALKEMVKGVQLPKAIANDEYKDEPTQENTN